MPSTQSGNLPILGFLENRILLIAIRVVRNLTRLALRLKPVIAEKAKENQRGGQGGILLSQKSVEAKPIDTQKELAVVAGLSHDTIAKVEKIENEAPEQIVTASRKGEGTAEPWSEIGRRWAY